jgi:hypothetical protein
MSDDSRSGPPGRSAAAGRWRSRWILAGAVLLVCGTAAGVTVGLTTGHSNTASGHPAVTPSATASARLSCGSPSAGFVVGTRSWPDCTDTGVPAGTTLTKMVSPAPTGNGGSTVTEITQNGTVINGIELTGSLDVWANNVTIENSLIRVTSWWGINLRPGHHGLKVLHCTIIGLPGQGPDNGAEDYGVSSGGDDIEVGWSDISGFGDAISMGSGYIHDNYVHDLRAFIPAGYSGYNHDDAFISDGGSGLTIEHNTFLDQVPVQKGASASIGLYDDATPVTNVTVTDNFMAGGAYALYPGGGPTSRNIVISGNVFSTMYFQWSGYYGPVASGYWHSGGGNSWSDNSWADGAKAGQAVQP